MICIHKNATANAPLIINGVPSLQRWPWSHVPHTSSPDTCFLNVLVTLFTAWHALDFVPTLYELKQWPGLTIPPLLVTCAMLMTYKMSSKSFFHCTHPHAVSLCRTYASLFHNTGFDNVSAFLSQNNKALFLPSCTWSVFMSRLAVALLDWRPFPVSPCKLLNRAQLWTRKAYCCMLDKLLQQGEPQRHVVTSLLPQQAVT